MCKLGDSDFCYGAFLKMMCDAGKAPKQLKTQGRSAPTYLVADERGGKDQIYVLQYTQAKDNPSKDYDSWTYKMGDKMICRLKEYHEQGYDVYSTFIGLKEKGDQEIAFVGYEDVIDCLGVNRGTMGQRSITVQREPGKKCLRVFGTGRSIMIGEKDNAIHIKRNAVPFR